VEGIAINFGLRVHKTIETGCKILGFFRGAPSCKEIVAHFHKNAYFPANLVQTLSKLTNSLWQLNCLMRSFLT
jgi:hypothetical protein